MKILVSAVALVTGCSAGSSHGPKTSPGDGGADVGVVQDASMDVAADVDAGGPVISGVTVTLNPKCVLSATVTFTTDRPSVGTLHVVNKGAPTANVIDAPAEPSPVTSHALNILGMRAASEFTVAVSAADAAGRTSTVTTTTSTPALPDAVPVPTVVVNDKTAAAPGFVVINSVEWSGSPANLALGGSFTVALDADLEVVWYNGGGLVDPQRLPNGDFVTLLQGGNSWEELTMMGDVVQNVVAKSIGVDALSHAITPEDGGTMLSLAPTLRMVHGFPGGADGGKRTLPVVGGTVVELPADGGMARVISNTFDYWDPVTMEGDPNMFDTPFWNYVYKNVGNTYDWIHDNAVVPDTDGNIVVSSRTQGWIYKVGRDGKLVWRLGAGGDFTLTNPGETFQYGQHGAYVTPSGTIMCLDDGNDRPLQPGQQAFSRAVEYTLDTTHMTATIVWQFQDSFLSTIFGSTYVLRNGNVLVDDGCNLTRTNGSAFDPSNQKYTRIMEVTHTTPPVKVMEVKLDTPIGAYPSDPEYSGFASYRAYKWESLYTAGPFDH